MAELDTFELRLRSAVHRYLEDAPSAEDAAAVVRRAVSASPRRRSWPGALPGIRPFGLSPVVAWLLIAMLLVLATAALLVAGGGLERAFPAVLPPVTGVAACPAGSTPDQPGRADQARPLSDELRMVFDRASGRIVALAPVVDGSGWDTWILDVCTNTWTRAASVTGAPGGDAWPSVAYDADADVTVAIDNTATPWVYDLGAGTWTQKATAVERAGRGRYRLVVNPLSGLVYAQRIARDLWTYDVESDTWGKAVQTGTFPRLVGSTDLLLAFDVSVDRIVAVLAHPNRSATWRFDPRSGQWTAGASGPLFNTGFFASGGEIAFDEASKRIVVFSDGHAGAYDTSLDTWETIYGQSWTAALPSTGPQHRQGHWMVYDPVNERLVVAGGSYRTSDGWVRADDVWAFDTATREWIELVAPGRVERYDDTTDTWRPVSPTHQP